jgi:hypothetical protein
MTEKCFHYKDGHILDHIKSVLGVFSSLIYEYSSRMGHDAISIGNKWRFGGASSLHFEDSFLGLWLQCL